MGRLVALDLHRKGHQITLLDRDTKQGKQSSAYAAAGLLTPLGEAFKAEPNIVAMGLAALQKWPALVASLDEPVFFQQQGALMVCHEQDKGDFLRQQRYLQQHYAEHPMHTLDRAGIEALEPELGRSFNLGLYLPEEGQIGNRRLLIALQKQLQRYGINWLEQSDVTSLCAKSGQVSYQRQEQQYSITADIIIDCRGVNAAETHNGLANSSLSTLRGVRGELFQLFAPEVNISRPIRLMHPRYQLYIAPKSKGFYVVGATEIESEDKGPMTVRSALELLSAAYSVHPGFAEAQIRQHVSALRPAFQDNQPKLIRNNKLIHVNGLFRHGFLIAPIIMEQTTALVEAMATSQISLATLPHNQFIQVQDCD